MLDAGSHARLIYCRLGGQDWQFSNVTANATYQFIGPTTTGLNLTNTGDPKTFELRGKPRTGRSYNELANHGSYKLGIWIRFPAPYTARIY
jgi:hypothetical protein